MSDALLKTPLDAAHRALGARMVPFAGYEMPVQYEGILAEASAVRNAAGMFDVSHMARLRFHGSRALEFLEMITSNDVSKLEDGTGQYSLLTNPNGGVVDDIIVYRLSVNEYRMVVNAANHAKDWAWIQAQNKYDVQVEDLTESTAMIAVQGPKAVDILSKIEECPDALRAAPMFGVVHGAIGGVPCFAARSGYTGEDGFELICTADHAEELWNTLLKEGVVPCGLGSRDVLRVEAGLPLYGHELTDELSPISAGLGWVIGKEKTFIGCEHIRKAQAEGTPRRLVGVKLNSKRLPTPGMGVFVGDRQVGEVCSGIYSPVLGVGAAFAFVDSDVPLKTEASIEMRGKMEPATIVGKRFMKREKSA